MPKKEKGKARGAQQALRGMPYPAKKKDIVEYARNKGADTGTVDMLALLLKDEYRNEAEVLDEIKDKKTTL